MKIDIDKFLQQNNDIKKIEAKYYCKRSRYLVSLPDQFTNDLCRFIGIMHGDGNLSYNRILITDENKEYHITMLHPIFKELFNLQLNLYHDQKRSSYYSHIKSSILFRYLIQVLEFSSGSVRCSLEKKIPSYLPRLNSEEKSHYIAGLYDAEGHVKKRQIEIDFSINSEPIWNFIKTFFNESSIRFGTLIRNRSERKPEYEIYIYGKKNVSLFCQLIPMMHPAKLERINRFLATR